MPRMCFSCRCIYSTYCISTMHRGGLVSHHLGQSGVDAPTIEKSRPLQCLEHKIIQTSILSFSPQFNSSAHKRAPCRTHPWWPPPLSPPWPPFTYHPSERGLTSSYSTVADDIDAISMGDLPRWPAGRGLPCRASGRALQYLAAKPCVRRRGCHGGAKTSFSQFVPGMMAMDLLRGSAVWALDDQPSDLACLLSSLAEQLPRLQFKQ
jgi:hypothetical protein